MVVCPHVLPALDCGLWELTYRRSSQPKKTVEESKEWMTKETKAFNPKTENFAVLLKNSKNDQGELRMIGKVGIFQFPAEISWMLHPDFWGKGYASEAVQGFLDWYWKDEGIKSIPRRLL